MERNININDFDYPLPDERIAKFPLDNRSDSKLLIYRNGNQLDVNSDPRDLDAFESLLKMIQ